MRSVDEFLLEPLPCSALASGCLLPSLVGLGFVVSGNGEMTGDASLVGDSWGLVPFKDPGAKTRLADPLALACFSKWRV